MAAVTPIANVQALVRAIEKSGLLAADKLAHVRELGEKAAEPKQLARDLVKEGTLTKWQAEQLLNGFYRLVLGKFKLLDQLRSTPTGRLYLAEHAQFGRRHTLKVLAKRLAADPHVVAQFLEAAKHACGLDHRNISHIYDVNHDPERKNHYIVMEHVEGETLEDLVTRGGPVGALHALDFVGQAAEGLAHAHGNGVVHGDIKPANLLLDHSGTVKILDMSQAGAGAALETENPDESIEMAALAAVIFQPPELRGDGQVVDVACDVYSLGSVLCFLLTGQAAPDEARAAALLRERSGLPPEMIDFCRNLMADKPADRPYSMNAVIERLNIIAKTIVAASEPEAKASQPPPSRTPAGRSQVESPPEAETAPRPKKPPVAKSLDDAGVPPIIISAEPRPVIDPEPIGSIVIKTKGRVGRKPPPQPASPTEASEEPATKPAASSTGHAAPSPVASPALKPLVLAGAIGGGGVLALGLLAAVVFFFAFGRKPTQPAKAATAASPAAARPVEPAAGEANPEALGAERNPDPGPLGAQDAAASAAPAGSANAGLAALPVQDRAAEPVPPATEPQAVTAKSAPATGASPVPASVEPSAVPEKAPAATATAKPVAIPPAEPAPAAKAAAAKPAPKSDVKREPFVGFAVAVDLPQLPETAGQVGGDVLAPVPLGPCKINADAPLSLVLHGGESALRTPRQKFELHPKSGENRQWEIALVAAGSPATVGNLSVNSDQLMFQWTAEGLKQAALARQLCNCALELTAGKSRHVVALRLPFLGDPLLIDLEKSGVNAKWNISDLPATKQTFIEVKRVEGLEPVKLDPKDPVNPGTPIAVWGGPAEKPAPLLLKLNPTLAGRGITVNLLPQVKLEGWPEPRFLRRRELVALQQQAAQELPNARNRLEAAKRDRPSTVPAKALIEAPMIEQRRLMATNEVNTLSTVLDQITFVVDFADNAASAAKIHFRVFHQADKVQVNLLVTEAGQPVREQD